MHGPVEVVVMHAGALLTLDLSVGCVFHGTVLLVSIQMRGTTSFLT